MKARRTIWPHAELPAGRIIVGPLTRVLQATPGDLSRSALP